MRNGEIQSTSQIVPGQSPSFSFGVIADVQYADIEDSQSFDGGERRSYVKALQGLREAVKYWNYFMTTGKDPDISSTSSTEIDFIAQLGDIIDGQNAGKYGRGLTKFTPANPQSEVALKVVLDVLNECKCRNVYHAIGNHELYNFNRDQLQQRLNTIRDGHEWYSFKPCKGWKVIMLDSYDIAIVGRETSSPEYQAALTLLKKNNPNDVLSQGSVDWFAGLSGYQVRFVPFNGGIGLEQLEWLRKTLQESNASDERIIILSHAPVLPEACDIRTLIWNYDEVLSIIRQTTRGSVVAFFAGHAHLYASTFDEISGTYHITLNTPLTTADKGFCHGIVEAYTDHLKVLGKGCLPTQILPFVTKRN